LVACTASAARFGYFEEMAIIAPGSTVAKNSLGLRLGGAVACMKNRGVFNCFTNDLHIVALILILYGAWKNYLFNFLEHWICIICGPRHRKDLLIGFVGPPSISP
jgi:hypothetical protein